MVAGDTRADLKVAVVLAFTLALVGWWNALAGQWLPADEPIIHEHPLVAGPPARGHTSGLFYRPVRTLSLALDHSVWELNPAGYHLSNVVYHAMSAVLVFGIARQTGLSPRAAILACALYVAHPVHTDAVTPIAGRREVLVGMFYLAAIFAFLRWRRFENPLALVALFACSVAAVYTKEMAITIPATGLALQLALDGRPRGARAKLFVAWAAVVLIATAHALALQAGPGLPRTSPTAATFATGARAFGFYLWISVWPVKLVADYSHAVFRLSTSAFEPAALAAYAALGIAVTLLVRWRTRAPRMAAAAAAFGITLAPALQLVNTPEVVAEHTLHLPLAALALAVAGALEAALEKHPRALALGLSALVAAGCARISVRNRDWHDIETSLQATVRDAPMCARAWTNLGLVHETQGRPADAEADYQRALSILPDDALTLSNLGALLMQRGALGEARGLLARAVELAPEMVGAWNNLGAVECELGDLPKAIERLGRALALKPDHVPALLNLGMALRRQGGPSIARAESVYRQAIALDPDNASAYNNLGALYLDAGRAPEAEQVLLTAVRLAPAAGSLMNLARAHASQGKTRAAEEALLQAASMAPPSSMEVLECARLASEMKLDRVAKHLSEKAGRQTR